MLAGIRPRVRVLHMVRHDSWTLTAGPAATHASSGKSHGSRGSTTVLCARLGATASGGTRPSIRSLCHSNQALWSSVVCAVSAQSSQVAIPGRLCSRVNETLTDHPLPGWLHQRCSQVVIAATTIQDTTLPRPRSHHQNLWGRARGSVDETPAQRRRNDRSDRGPLG